MAVDYWELLENKSAEVSDVAGEEVVLKGGEGHLSLPSWPNLFVQY